MNKSKFLALFLILAISFYSFSAEVAKAGGVVSSIMETIIDVINTVINSVVALVEGVIGGALSFIGIDNSLVEDAQCRWGSTENPLQDFTGCEKTPEGYPIVPSAPTPTLDLNSTAVVEIPDPINLSWRAINADTCSASGDWTGDKKPINDDGSYVSESISKPRGNYTFNLSCSGVGGSVSKSVNGQVIEVPRCSFGANPSTIVPPQVSTLSWNCQYADSCSIDQGIGIVCSSESSCATGTLNIRPTTATTFTLICQGLDGARFWQTTVDIGQSGGIKWGEIIPRW